MEKGGVHDFVQFDSYPPAGGAKVYREVTISYDRDLSPVLKTYGSTTVHSGQMVRS